MTELSDTAKEAALDQYARMQDEFAECEQTVRDRLPQLADEAGGLSDLYLRAYRAEDADPLPADPPWCGCPPCQGFLLQVRWETLMGRRSAL